MSELIAPPRWQSRAACAGLPFERFFPEPGGSTPVAAVVCASCPVLDQCREWALTDRHAPLEGYLAGMTADQRRPLRRRIHLATVAPASVVMSAT